MSMLCCRIGRTRIEKRPTTAIWVNGTLMTALWDTGTEASTISWDQFCNLKYKPWFKKCEYRVMSTRGRNMRVLGVTQLQFSIGAHEFLHNMAVLADCMNEFQSVNLGFKLGGETRDGEMRVEHGKYVSEGLCKIRNGKGVIVVHNNGIVPIQIRRGQQMCLINSVRRPNQPLQQISSPKEKVGTICGQTKLNASSARNSTTQRLKSTAEKEGVAWIPKPPICSSEPLWNMSNEKMGINTVRKRES